MPHTHQEFIVPAVSETFLADLTAALHEALTSLRVEDGRLLLPSLEEFSDLGFARLIEAHQSEARAAEESLLEASRSFQEDETEPLPMTREEFADLLGWTEVEIDARLMRGEHLFPGAVYHVRLPEIERWAGEDRPEEERPVEVTVHRWDRTGTSSLAIAFREREREYDARVELHCTARGFSGLEIVVHTSRSGGEEPERLVVEVDADRWMARLRGERGPAPVSIRRPVATGELVFLLSPVTAEDGRWRVALDVEAHGEVAEDPAWTDEVDLAETAEQVAEIWRLYVADIDVADDLRLAARALRRADARFPLRVLWPLPTPDPEAAPGPTTAPRPFPVPARPDLEYVRLGVVVVVLVVVVVVLLILAYTLLP
ncbi:hypothetical protein AB0I72_10690 [Nocardiopsis sp. NPDC049922]|uniref:hypothetical protein n=1 Tax=Nocardiopsis sp. NPDC049922 TaxID=3155157 RepID=UPI003409E741